jgi:RNA 3'-terminal phosphate cyclase (ATP)
MESVEIVEVDGSRGEGGGQILRTSLALSLLTGKRMRIRKIRARRPRPGLMAQHLMCVKAAQRLCNAGVDGAELGSTAIDFLPGPVLPSRWTFDIGTAGSVGLVLQTILVPMLLASGPCATMIEGGTHNKASPPFDFLERCYLPILRRMGARVRITLDTHGFYPAGGGRIIATTEPSGGLNAIALDEALPVQRRRARALVARLPRSIGERELAVVRKELGWSADECAVEEVSSPGPGNALVLEAERADGTTAVVTGFGERGLAAETVAARAARELNLHLGSGTPVDEHLADQLLLPMAIAGAGRFRTGPLSLHATTNIDTIQQFVDVPIRTTRQPGGATLVEIG